MSRGRPRNTTPTVQWSIMMPIDLALQVETRLMDPVTQRATYAARSKLIQSLLHDWLQTGIATPQVSNPVPNASASTDKGVSLGAGNTETGELPAGVASKEAL